MSNSILRGIKVYQTSENVRPNLGYSKLWVDTDPDFNGFLVKDYNIPKRVGTTDKVEIVKVSLNAYDAKATWIDPTATEVLEAPMRELYVNEEYFYSPSNGFAIRPVSTEKMNENTLYRIETKIELGIESIRQEIRNLLNEIKSDV